MVGYFDSDEGVPVVAPAGGIACFSSTVFQRRGPNTTSNRHQAVPFLDGGRVVSMA